MSGETSLQEIIDSIDQGYLVVDGKGKVEGIGARAAALLGRDPGSVAGLAAADVIAIDGLDGVFSGEDSALLRCLNAGEEWRSPARGVDIRARDGGTMPMSLHLRPLSGKRALLLIDDATATRELLDANDGLVSITSHELKTPLTAIKAMSELMMSYELEESQRKEITADIYSQAERLEQLIRDILDASQIDSGRMVLDVVPVVLADVIDEVRDEMQTYLEKREVRVELDPDLPLVEADSAKLHQVLVNLISNALKYSPESAAVTVRARQEADAVRVEVEDAGVGIHENDLDRLFKKFQRIKDPAFRGASGTGLGLHIVKGLVELHGGTVGVSSIYGKGSTFFFTMPASAATADPLEA